ncbi:hypothetical protein [Luteolibacter sp. LG18]|uniref:hypothetical protein n=1 Tax=Luteolibacter sp. LG18 TaxID=2819286 RepID=UPI0030C7139D
MSAPWPFDQSPNCATFTTSLVMREHEPITHVYHDEDDHAWQFHAADAASEDQMMIVALKEVVDLDPSVLEVADLPPGWMAIRPSLAAPWKRTQVPVG